MDIRETVSRSTLADANELRDWRIYHAEIAIPGFALSSNNLILTNRFQVVWWICSMRYKNFILNLALCPGYLA